MASDGAMLPSTMGVEMAPKAADDSVGGVVSADVGQAPRAAPGGSQHVFFRHAPCADQPTAFGSPAGPPRATARGATSRPRYTDKRGAARLPKTSQNGCLQAKDSQRFEGTGDRPLHDAGFQETRVIG